MTVETKVVSKIRKLLALANDGRGNEQERETALRQAHSLLAAHNLEMHDIGDAAPQEKRDRAYAEYYGRPWARTASAAIAKLFFCAYLYRPNSNANNVCVQTFIGKESNVQTAIAMAQYIVESIRKEARVQGKGQGDAWQRSFCLGAAHKIYARVEKMIAEATKPAAVESNSRALVLASLYQTEAAANALMVGPTRTGRSGKQSTSWEARAAGAAYGETVSLNKQIGGTPANKQLK
jgi:hypothetical protein